MELYVYPQIDSTRLSFDPDCIAAMACLNLARAEWTVHYVASPRVSPAGLLPMLRDGPTVVSGLDAIVAHLQAQGADPDANLPPEKQTQTTLYRSLLEGPLLDALQATWWLDADNWALSTRPLLAARLPWLTKYYATAELRRAVCERLGRVPLVPSTPAGGGKAESRMVPAPVAAARTGYQALARRLGKSQFILGGDAPTLLDAVAYAHLVCHSFPSLQHADLFAMLSFEFPSLVEYQARLAPVLFATPPKPAPAFLPPTSWSEARDSVTHAAAALWRGFSPLRLRSVSLKSAAPLLQVAAALAVFSGYVWYHGLVQIGGAGESDDDDE